jgi:CRP-like cAMP-binding protein
MPIDAFAERLRNLEIFRGLAPLQITEITRNAERMVFRDGQAIITAGRQGDGAFVLIAGEARAVWPDPTLPASPVPAGALVGEMAMLIEHAHAMTVVAQGPVRALKIPREALHRQMAADPALTEHLVARIASRLTPVAVELRRIDQTLALAAESVRSPA